MNQIIENSIVVNKPKLTSHDDGSGVMKGHQRRKREDHEVDAHPLVPMLLKKQCLCREERPSACAGLTMRGLSFCTLSFRLALLILVETLRRLEQEFVVEVRLY